MKSFPALSRNEEQVFGEGRCTLLLRFLSPCSTEKQEIRECSVETVQPSARARSPATGLDR